MAGMPRVAIGRMWQEANDFSMVATTQADWIANGVLRGEELAPAVRGQRAAELGGFVDALETWPGGCELVPLAGAWWDMATDYATHFHRAFSLVPPHERYLGIQ